MEAATFKFDLQHEGVQVSATIPEGANRAAVIAEAKAWIGDWKSAGFSQVVRSYGGARGNEKVESWAVVMSIDPFLYKGVKKGLRFVLAPEKPEDFETRTGAAYEEAVETILAKLPKPLADAIRTRWAGEWKGKNPFQLSTVKLEAGFCSSNKDGSPVVLDIRTPSEAVASAPAPVAAPVPVKVEEAF